MADKSTDLSFLDCRGGMAERLRQYDWRKHPLGAPESWPQSLKIVVRIMLTSRYAMWMGWGEELYFFCNDAYLPTVGLKKDWVLGAPASKVWAEIWPDIGPRAATVLKDGEATWDEGLLLFLERSGFAEETYHTFSYSPIPAGNDGKIGGLLCVVTEETDRIIGERRLAALRDAAARLDVALAEPELFRALREALEKTAKDAPFTLLYLFDDEKTARLACSTGVKEGSGLAPLALDLNDEASSWPAKRVLEVGGVTVVSDLAARFGELPKGPWDKAPKEAAIVPLFQQGQERAAGFFVSGLNPYRTFDDAYRSFLELLAGQIAAALSNARAYESERRRAEALADLDRAKTTFFSNISHELRTPLTLMLGPLEDEIRAGGPGRESLELAHRNGLRLLKLVNSLLDFSRIEAGRVEANFQATDLAHYTAELASVFRSAIEKAGLKFVVECGPIEEAAFIDRSLWEKIVLNLLSNAFKFTFEGEIAISVRVEGEFFEMAVRDTGAGIPAGELENLFARFHRVRATKSRSIEGTGIGLALVKELAELHGGTVRVESIEGRGSTFRVTVKRGKAHLPAKQVDHSERPAREISAGEAFISEASRWSGDTEVLRAASRKTAGARILIADDNSDMREYLTRLLADSYVVETVSNGQEALEALNKNRPDLIITDVMMPVVDGFAFLQKIRADARTRSLPLIMLSARAGEEARIEGLNAGADDYLVKPFSARELLARVQSQLQLAELRRKEEEKINQILESITDAFYTVNPNWEFVMLNDAALRSIGEHLTKPEDLVGKNLWAEFPELVGTPAEAMYRRAAEEKIPGEVEQFYGPWGRWFSTRAFPIRGGGISVLFRDVTDRKAAERASEHLASIIKALSVDVEGTIITWNPAAEQMFGYTAAEAIGKPLRLIAPADGDISQKQIMERVFRGEVVPRYETVRRRKHGDLIEVSIKVDAIHDPSGRVASIAGLITDISERKQAERVLAQSATRFRQLANAMPQLVWSANPDGSVDYYNERIELFGCEKNGDGSWNWPTMVYEGDRAKTSEAWLKAVESEQPYQCEHRIRMRDGSLRWHLSRGVPARDESGRVVKWFGTATDIHDLKQTQLELEKTRSSLEETVAQRTEKLRESIGELEAFSYSVSHDMRAPLRAMEGFSRILLNEYRDKLDEAGYGLLQRIEKGARRLDMLVQDVLAYSRVAKSDFQLHPVDLQALVEETIQNFEFQTARIHIENRLPMVMAHEALLSQVVSNLLSNATKFARAGVPSEVKVSSVRIGKLVKVSIIDNGIGIEPEHFERIFQIFGRIHAERMYSGTGIGLTIVKKAIERLGGTVGVESTPGEGSHFWFAVAAID
jgi:PAS domain S-box-containing protein